ncbi:MAG: energy transducer TonB [Janthinobacterium lividum]
MPSGTATLPRPGAGFGTAWIGWRWAFCAALVLGLHAGLLLLLASTSTHDLVEPSTPPVLLIDVPPAPAASASAPTPPVPLQAPPEMQDPPALPDLPSLPRVPQTAAQVSPPPPHRLPSPRRPAPSRPMPRAVARPAASAPEPVQDVKASPQPSPAAVSALAAAAAAPARPNAIPTWQGQLVARLRRARAYPDDARTRGDTGTVLVSFAMDRAGHVLSVQVVRSSGLPSLDEAAMQTVHRAEPLPELPPEIPGTRYTVSVPISFTLR